MARTFLAVFFLGVCLHEAYVEGLAVIPPASYLREGDELRLQCNASSIAGDIRWELSGKIIDPQRLGFRVLPGLSTVIAATFTASQHEGSYRCIATPLQGGRILSCPSNVRKAALEEFQDEPKTVTAYEGGAAILPCAVPYSAPKASISWKKKGERKLGLLATKLLTSGSIYVEQLRVEDSGRYRCLADNDVAEMKRKSSFVTLQVEASPTNSTTLELHISPDTVAKAGDDVVLGCAAKGPTVPKYRWTYTGLLGDNRTRLREATTGYLELGAVTLADSGMYECEAYTDDGKLLQRQASVVLTVKASPSQVTIAEERDASGVVSLTCNVDPPGGLYNVTWSIPDNSTIGDGEGPSGSSITVTLDTAASGVYQCIVSNEFGCATGEKTLVFEGFTSSSLSVLPASSSAFPPEASQVFPLPPFIIDVIEPVTTSAPASAPTSVPPSPTSEAEPAAASASSSSAVSSTSASGVPSSSTAPGVATPSDSTIYGAASSSSLPGPTPTSSEPQDVTVPMATTPTPTTTPTAPPELDVWFDPPEATVAVGSNVTITCRSNQRATLELAYNLQTILASSDGRSVSHHLVHVKEENAGTIFCVGRVETPQAHKVVAFHLTVYVPSSSISTSPSVATSSGSTIYDVTVPMAATPTPTTIPTAPPELDVWFDPPEAMVAVGSSVTITCRSNQRATLELAYALQTILASSDGRSVSHHLVHVKEEDAGTIFCVGRVETPQAHKVVAFHLTVYVPSSSSSTSPGVATSSSSTIYGTASSSSLPGPTPTSSPQVYIDPNGEVSVEEGENVTVSCNSSVEGAILQLVNGSSSSSPSVVATVEGTNLFHTFYFVNGSVEGRYWCTLLNGSVTSEAVEITVTANRPMFKLEGVSVHWVTGVKVNISWTLPALPPWRSVLGYKLNWGKVQPSAVALMSVGAETSSVEVDVNLTGVVYVSVWAFSKGGEGPAVVLNVTVPMATTPTTTPTVPPELDVWFDRSDAMVAVGSNVTITCRSNQRATLELAYDSKPEHNSRPILASSVGMSVSHHLVHVKEKDTGVIYCVGRVETPPFHDVAAFNLTLCPPQPIYTMSCTAVSPSEITVTLEGGPAPKDGFKVNFAQDGIVIPVKQPSKDVSEGLSATLTGLASYTRYRIAVTVNGCDPKMIGRCLTRTLLNLTMPSTDSGMSTSLEMFKSQLEAFISSLEEEGIDTNTLTIEVDKGNGNGWEPIAFADIATVKSDQANVTFRVRVGDGPWAVSVVSLEEPQTEFDWTLPSTYIILLSLVVVVAILVTGVVVGLKYIQIQRREKDKVTDHRDEQNKRLSRQGSTRSTVSWTLKMRRSNSPEVKI